MSTPPPEKRTKITQIACDRCKSSKRKCDGQLPCAYCVTTKKSCSYNAVDRRRKNPLTGTRDSPITRVPVPPRAAASPNSFNFLSPSPSANNPVASTSALPPVASTSSQHIFTGTPTNSNEDDVNLSLLASAMAHEHFSPSDTSPEHPTGTSYSVDGEAAHPSFVERLHKHLTVTFALRSFPRGHSTTENEDGWDQKLDFAFLPERSEALLFVSSYFEAAAATYRYLDRDAIDAAVQKFYDGDAAVAGDIDATCLILLVLAVGCLWTPSWTSEDPSLKTPQAINLYRAAKQRLARSPMFPPRLITVQINLLMVQMNLGLTQFQTAWITFGHAARMAQLLGLHRCTSSTQEGTPADEVRRRVFWSAFMMDRYLSLVVGFPVLFDERDITQLYFTVPAMGGSNDGKSINQALIGSLAHVKLSRIMGHAIRLLKNDLPPSDRDRFSLELDTELEQWKLETPTFFHPSSTTGTDGGFVQVPEFFQRQQRVIHCAFHFLRLFTYRAYLLSSFLEHLPGTATPFAQSTYIPPQVRICVDAAVNIAKISAKIAEVATERQSKFGGTFWNTSYFTFASLTVLCVYTMVYENAPDRDEIGVLIEGAMRGHELLAGSTADERQNIVDESRRIGRLLKRRPGADQMDQLPQGEGTFDFTQNGSTDQQPAPLTNWDWMWLDMQGLVQAGFDDVNVGFDLEGQGPLAGAGSWFDQAGMVNAAAEANLNGLFA